MQSQTDTDNVGEQGGMPKAEEKIGKLEIVSFGAGHMGYVMTWSMVLSFLAFFYTDVIGISASFVGTLFLVMRIWDGTTDVAMGSLIDRTNSKHGKARPYVLWGAIPLVIAAVALFTVPNLSMTGKYAYILTIYSVYILMYTVVSIAMKTLLGQITQHEGSRATLGVSLAIGFAIGGLVVRTAAAPLASSIGGQSGWIVAAGLISLLALLLILFAFRFTKERVSNSLQEEEEKKHPLKLELRMLLKNHYWMIIFFFGFTLYVLYGLGSAEIYYAAHILGSTNYFSLIALAKAIPGLVLLFLVTPFVKRFGRQRTAVLGSILIMSSAIAKLIDPTGLTYFLIGSGIFGMGTALMSATIYTMVNDTVDFGEWKTGVRSAGLVNSSLSFGMKVGTGLGGAFIGWLLAFRGYVGTAPEQNAAAKQMIVYLNIHMHLVLGTILLILILFYKLDKHYSSIIADLQSGKRGT